MFKQQLIKLSLLYLFIFINAVKSDSLNFQMSHKNNTFRSYITNFNRDTFDNETFLSLEDIVQKSRGYFIKYKSY